MFLFLLSPLSPWDCMLEESDFLQYRCLESKDWGTLLVWCLVPLVSRNILQGRMSVSPVSCVRMLVDTQKECSFSFYLLCLPETVCWRTVTSFNTNRGDRDWRWLSSPLTVGQFLLQYLQYLQGPIVDCCDSSSNLPVSIVDSIYGTIRQAKYISIVDCCDSSSNLPVSIVDSIDGTIRQAKYICLINLDSRCRITGLAFLATAISTPPLPPPLLQPLLVGLRLLGAGRPGDCRSRGSEVSCYCGSGCSCSCSSSCSCSCSCSGSCSCSYSFFCSSYYSSFFSYCCMPARGDGTGPPDWVMPGLLSRPHTVLQHADELGVVGVDVVGAQHPVYSDSVIYWLLSPVGKTWSRVVECRTPVCSLER